jgi:hypothetical protein
MGISVPFFNPAPIIFKRTYLAAQQLIKKKIVAVDDITDVWRAVFVANKEVANIFFTALRQYEAQWIKQGAIEQPSDVLSGLMQRYAFFADRWLHASQCIPIKAPTPEEVKRLEKCTVRQKWNRDMDGLVLGPDLWYTLDPIIPTLCALVMGRLSIKMNIIEETPLYVFVDNFLCESSPDCRCGSVQNILCSEQEGLQATFWIHLYTNHMRTECFIKMHDIDKGGMIRWSKVCAASTEDAIAQKRSKPCN